MYFKKSIDPYILLLISFIIKNQNVIMHKIQKTNTKNSLVALEQKYYCVPLFNNEYTIPYIDGTYTTYDYMTYFVIP